MSIDFPERFLTVTIEFRVTGVVFRGFQILQLWFIFSANMVHIPCTVSYGKWSYGKSSHNLNLHQKVRTSNSIKWKNEENLNTDLLENCVKSKRPKALVAKQSFVRERITKFISFLIENQNLQVFHRNWWNISIFELNFRKKWKVLRILCMDLLGLKQISTRCRVCLSQILSLWRERDA